MSRLQMDRRTWIRGLIGSGALYGLDAAFTAKRTDAAQIGPNDAIKQMLVRCTVQVDCVRIGEQELDPAQCIFWPGLLTHPVWKTVLVHITPVDCFRINHTGIFPTPVNLDGFS